MNEEDKIILGVVTKSVSLEQAMELLDRAIEERRPTPVAFLNAHTALLAAEVPSFRKAMQGFTVFNDGLGVDTARLLKYGNGFPQNLNGTDFTPAYLDGTTRQLRLFLLGARAVVVEKTRHILAGKYPQHTIVGCHDGYFPAKDNAKILEEIRASGADVLLVAMGNPAQEFWIRDNLDKTGAVVALGVGAFFDFTAQRFPRAPRIVRILRAEWFFRLLCEPKRLWKRYTVENIQFLAYALRDAVAYRRSRKKLPGAGPESVRPRRADESGHLLG
jgi:alpha-1,3-mannosyltransferase